MPQRWYISSTCSVHLYVVGEILSIADAAKQRYLLVPRQVRQVVNLIRESTKQVGLRLLAERCLGDEILPRPAAIAGDELSLPVRFGIERNAVRQAQVVVEVLVVVVVEALDVNADVFQQLTGNGRIARRRIDRLGTAVRNLPFAAHVELVAFGVATKVIVVIEHQNACVRMLAPIEVRRRQTANATADNHQVDILIDLGCLPSATRYARMHRLPGTFVAAAQTGFCRRVVAGWQLEVLYVTAEGIGPRAYQGGANGHTRAVKKIPTGCLVSHWVVSFCRSNKTSPPTIVSAIAPSRSAAGSLRAMLYGSTSIAVRSAHRPTSITPVSFSRKLANADHDVYARMASSIEKRCSGYQPPSG